MAPRKSKRKEPKATSAAVSAKDPSPPVTAERESSQSNGNLRNYYLLKSEPHVFSIDDLKNQKHQQDEWNGVRNFVARNHLQSMKVNDRCWFYHSSCKEPAIVGVCRVVREAQPDASALDPKHEYYDPKSAPEKCRWVSVLIELESIYDTKITLSELRAQAKVNPTIADLQLLKMSRLSVVPITLEQWHTVEQLIQRKEQGEDLIPHS